MERKFLMHFLRMRLWLCYVRPLEPDVEMLVSDPWLSAHPPITVFLGLKSIFSSAFLLFL